jgi:hypothetical protein
LPLFTFAGIIEAIGDSLWFKALDLQQCGLSDDIAKAILELLEYNKTLVIVDVRLNAGLREETLKEISRQLDRNDLRSENEYRWLNIPQKDVVGKRVSSATSLQKQRPSEMEGGPSLARPRSAMIRQVKRPIAPIIFRKALAPGTPQIIKRIKTKSPLPVLVPEKRARQPMKPLERAQVRRSTSKPPQPPPIPTPPSGRG